MLELMARGGMRVGEVLKLTPNDILDRKLILTETDTLWGIAKRFYGSGFYYPVLQEHNPDLAIYTIGKKDRIAVLKDSGTVKRVFPACQNMVQTGNKWR